MTLEEATWRNVGHWQIRTLGEKRCLGGGRRGKPWTDANGKGNLETGHVAMLAPAFPERLDNGGISLSVSCFDVFAMGLFGAANIARTIACYRPKADYRTGTSGEWFLIPRSRPV